MLLRLSGEEQEAEIFERLHRKKRIRQRERERERSVGIRERESGSKVEDAEIKTRAGGFGYTSQQESNVRRLSLLMWPTFEIFSYFYCGVGPTCGSLSCYRWATVEWFVLRS